MTYDTILATAQERMGKALDHTQDQLRHIRTSRASAGLVENLRVDYYGSPTPLLQMAQISIPEPRQIMIKPFDVSTLGEITKTLLKSELGISPENDGKVVRLTMPPLSGDQREKYAAKAKGLAEEGRIAIRSVRRDANKEADALMKDGSMAEDVCHDLHDAIQKLLKEYEGKVGEIQDKKTAEILEV
ncbi:MAG: ribosome recycling factor [Planctomycetota bacterium]|nr:ribosome recycling factor [Planctomycetota bacterium]